ncbi:MAG: Asp-tRNA(Asn)/Glu-tRNA(Gln) amidotransferase subunit GatC [Minisyncoccia bacterium]
MNKENLINSKMVEYLSDLSRLEISEEEKEKIEKDLNLILDYVNQLEAVDIKNVDLEQTFSPSKTSDGFEEENLLFANDDLIDGFYQRKDNWLEIPPIF